MQIVDADPGDGQEMRRALVVRQPGQEADQEADEAISLNDAIEGWLHAKGYRSARAQSSRTGWEYAADLIGAHGYQLACQHQGLDLDSHQTARLGQAAQAWASTPRANGRPVSAATRNRRLASVSSFYRYAIRFDLPDATGVTVRNPIERVERETVHPFAGAQALDQSDVLTRLAAIDLATLTGKRDTALLLVALTTGRRLAELQALRWGDVQLRDSGRIARIIWRRTKGGKMAYDDLDATVTDALMTWLYAAYGARIGSLASDKPLWLPSRRGEHLPPIGEERAMGHDAIRAVYINRLDTGKVHTSRHTFSAAMLASGASVVELQERLGHSNLETTGHYARALNGATNPYAGKLASYFGLGNRPRRAAATTRPLSKR